MWKPYESTSSSLTFGEQCLNMFRLDLRIIALLLSGGKGVLGISEVQPHARTVDRSSWLAT